MKHKGQIFSIYCENFVTYSQVTVYPEHNLNFIIGPNGSGKSTIVSAIVLGMGGDPKLLSRSNNIGDFVKNSQTEACIKISLCKDSLGNTCCFQRNFNKSGKSKFMIDSKAVPLKAYMSQVKSFNIQIDNLCQFLPQDRVQDFAKMNPQEILQKTQESICSFEMRESFIKLKELRLKQLNGEDQLMNNRDKLKDAEARLAELQKEVDKINKKTKTEEVLKICQTKKCWLEVESISERILLVKKELLEATKFVNRDEKIYKEIKAKGAGLLANTDVLREQENEHKRNAKKYEQKLEELTAKHDELTSQIRLHKNQVEDKKKEEEQRGQELLRLAQLIAVEEEDLNNTLTENGSEELRKAKYDQLTEKLSKLKNVVNQLFARLSKINKDLDNEFLPEIQHIRRKIELIENVSEQKMNYLQDKHPNVHSAVLWLRSNRNKFNGRIYEPMILELNVADSSYAKYFENSISGRDLLAFTCTDKKDMSDLLRYLCTEKNLKINILHSKFEEACTFKTNSVERFRPYGFHSFLLDLIEGPAPILNYLCKINRIHNILVGSDEANKYTDHVPDDIRLYYAGNSRYSISISKYSGESSSMRNTIVSTYTLSMSINKTELENLKTLLNEKLRQSDILKNERSQFEAKINHFEKDRNEMQCQKRELESIKLKVERHYEKIRGIKNKIQRVQNEACSIEEERAKFQEYARTTVITLFDILKEQETYLEKLQKAIETQNFITTKINIIKFENADIENEIKSAASNLQKSQRLVNTIKASSDRIKNEYETKLNLAKNMCNNKSPEDTNFPYRQAFEKLPNDMDSIDDKISDLQARVECMSAGNNEILEDYEERKNYIATLQATMESTVDIHKNLDSQIDKIHKEWYPKLMEFIDIIRNNFSKYMRYMNFTGDIKLSRNSENDYESYGIQILVQYRAGAPLRILDRNVQSGGERAVAIATYTLALQHISNAPFRCVDEINQGMDPNNERKIIDMLIEETHSIQNSCQYFFVTPKLLLNVDYKQKSNMLVVFNGSLMPSNSLTYLFSKSNVIMEDLYVASEDEEDDEEDNSGRPDNGPRVQYEYLDDSDD